jgi:hypothetical protein
MLSISTIRRSLGIGALALLAACGAPDSASAPTAAPAPTTIAPSPTPFPAPDASATPEPAPTLTPSPLPYPTFTPTETAAPSTPEASMPSNVVLQLDYQPGFSRPEVFSPAGRVPPFTLLDDGRVIYVDSGNPPSFSSEQVMLVQLSPEQAQALIKQVLDLGFERLESHTDMCGQSNSQQACIADASTSVLRVRLPSGELREIRNYANFANDPKALEAILTLLNEYQATNAQPYVPERASLFLQQANGSPENATVRDWPLDPALLIPPQTDARQWATVLQSQALGTLLAAIDRNTGDFFFRHEGQIYNAYLVPWLPGADYTDEVGQFVIR